MISATEMRLRREAESKGFVVGANVKSIAEKPPSIKIESLLFIGSKDQLHPNPFNPNGKISLSCRYFYISNGPHIAVIGNRGSFMAPVDKCTLYL